MPEEVAVIPDREVGARAEKVYTDIPGLLLRLRKTKGQLGQPMHGAEKAVQQLVGCQSNPGQASAALEAQLRGQDSSTTREALKLAVESMG